MHLEAWGPDDLPLLEKTVGDPAMMVYLGGAESAEKMAERQEKYAAPDSGMFKVVDDQSGQAIGAVNTLPLDLQGLTTTVTNPDIYALGTVISAVSFTVITLALGTIHVLNKRQAAKGSDAGKGLV